MPGKRWCEATGKLKYESEFEAQLSLLFTHFKLRNEDQKRHAVVRASHPCEHCGWWHVTTKQPDGKYRRGLGDAIRNR